MAEPIRRPRQLHREREATSQQDGFLHEYLGPPGQKDQQMPGPQEEDVTGGGTAEGGGGSMDGHLCPWTPHQAQTPIPVLFPGGSLDPAIWGDPVTTPFPLQSSNLCAIGEVSEAQTQEAQPMVAAT